MKSIEIQEVVSHPFKPQTLEIRDDKDCVLLLVHGPRYGYKSVIRINRAELVKALDESKG